jgi:Na+-driven multidrug efflux pump
MGMFGAVLATCLSPMISLFILSFHFIGEKNHLRFQLIAVKLSTFIDIVKLGNPAFISEFSSSVVLIVFNLTILRLEGNIGIAAYGIIANIALIVVAIFTGVCQGMQPLISRGYGRRDSEGIKKTIRYAIVTVFVIALVVYLITVGNADKIISLFNKDQSKQLIIIATKGFRIYFIGLIFAGFNMVVATYLNATEKPRSAMIISLIRGILLIIPCVIILSSLYGITGVWLALVMTEVIVTIGIVIVRLSSERISIHLELQYEIE